MRRVAWVPFDGSRPMSRLESEIRDELGKVGHRPDAKCLRVLAGRLDSDEHIEDALFGYDDATGQHHNWLLVTPSRVLDIAVDHGRYCSRPRWLVRGAFPAARFELPVLKDSGSPGYVYQWRESVAWNARNPRHHSDSDDLATPARSDSVDI